VPGDSVLVLQPASGRGSLFSLDGAFIREVRLPAPFVRAVVVRWPDSVLVVGMLGDRERFGWPLHLTSFRENRASISASGGAPRNGEFNVADWIDLAVTDTQPWWTIQRPYILSEYGPHLQHRRSLARSPSWWTEDRANPVGIPHQQPPHPGINAVAIDSEGLLWVFLRVPGPDWRTAWAEVPVGATEIPTARVRYHKLFVTLVEVIDPIAERVLTRATLDHFVIAALPGRRAVSYIDAAGAAPQVHILQFSLTR
jgi:hypothetical protein